jgi:hypothetical protein
MFRKQIHPNGFNWANFGEIYNENHKTEIVNKLQMWYKLQLLEDQINGIPIQFSRKKLHFYIEKQIPIMLVIIYCIAQKLSSYGDDYRSLVDAVFYDVVETVEKQMCFWNELDNTTEPMTSFEDEISIRNANNVSIRMKGKQQKPQKSTSCVIC